jgi:hypothetical protein
MNALDPALKIKYRDGDRVDVALAGDVTNIVRGTVRGISAQHVLDWWIIELDEPIEGWEYSCITEQHTFLRREGSNQPFLCERHGR